ncbi:MAG: hypothetical protein AAFO93_09965 [Pseudomonadota bacterium]
MSLATRGWQVFDWDAEVAAWAAAAHRVACEVTRDPAMQDAWLRHGKTWFVGVDVMPNAGDGSVDGVPLRGPWSNHVSLPATWHSAQISVVYPGYPQQDLDESDANHRFRKVRFAAHVDGILPVGPERRRIPQEPHAWILGLPLNASDAAPLVVWEGSAPIMRRGLREAIGERDPRAVDVTEAYQAARREVFETCVPHRIDMGPGQAVLVHRLALHGVAPFAEGESAPPEGRMVAYFRPELADAMEWLAEN